MPARGVGSKADREGSQEETAVPRVSTTQHPPPLFPSQAFHIGQTSLRFRAFECDSSGSPPACDEPNSSGLPTLRVVSPSSLLILGSRCTHTHAASVRCGAPHHRESTTSTGKVLFLPWRRTFSATASSGCGSLESRTCS